MDKCVGLVVKFRSKKTQYRLQDISNEPIKNPVPSAVKIKISKPKKTRDASQNTIVTFSPDCDVEMKEIVLSESDIDEGSNQNEAEHSDTSFDLTGTESETSDNEEGNEEKIQSSSICDENYFVSMSALKKLLVFCQECKKPAHVVSSFNKGAVLVVVLLCEANHETRWYSQHLIDGMPSGNLSMAASILLSGNTYIRIKEMMNIANVRFFSGTTYNHLQNRYLFPAINKVYLTNRELLFSQVREQTQLDILGDGRCDSPGYNAKYGTYTIMNSESGEILDFCVVHVATAGNSSRMELVGLQKVLETAEENDLEINSLTTDRHIQVRCFMKNEKPEINHQFDIWHVGKNIKRKLSHAAKNKKCEDLNLWIKAIVNHFWWCCASCDENVTELREKWLSILQHISNKHRWENAKIFKRCEHGKLSRRQVAERIWLNKGSPAYNALEKVVANKRLLSDLRYLTSFNHTGTLEVYHSLYNKYCPKRLHFSYKGMVARSQLAILDFNSGANRDQAVTNSGELRFKQSYSKVTKSWVVKKIPEVKDRKYLQHIMEEVEFQRISKENFPQAEIEEIPENIAPVDKPDKKEAIKGMRTRFVV